jgi:hypothetical protein
MVPLLLLTACLERVTDVAVPLDPRFYAGGGHAANPGAAAERLGPPWADVSGETRPVVLTLQTTEDGAIQIDVVVPDATAPGGLKRIGRIEGAEESVTLHVPLDVTSFSVEAFQDPESDGPSPSDPWGGATIDMAAVSGPVALVLVASARPAPGGASGGGAGPGGGDGGVVEPWREITGLRRIPFVGSISSPVEGEIQVDITEPDPGAPGGQNRVGQVRLPEAGAFTLDVPADRTKFRIEAFVDLAGDGPTADDPYAELTVVVAEINAEIVQLTLVAGSRGAQGSGGVGAPGGAPAAGPSEAPWSGGTGATRRFVAVVEGEASGELQVDVSEVDASAPGGQKRVGRLHLPAGGRTIEFDVPVEVTRFRIEAFTDIDHDGPTANDAWAGLDVDAKNFASPPPLRLEVGARGRPSAPAEAPPPSGGSPTDIPAITLGGAVKRRLDLPVMVDIFAAGADGTGRKHLGKVEADGERWTARVVPNLGRIVVEAYQDPAGDGPSKGDPTFRYPKPIEVGAEPIAGIDLVLP